MNKWKNILSLLLIGIFLFSHQASARFNRPDPVGLVDPATGKVNQQMLLNPQLQNRYVYALNNPYRYVDPDGNFPFLAAPLIAAGIAFFSGPDVANAPTSASTPIYESHGVRNIIAGTVGGAGVRGAGSVLAISNTNNITKAQQKSVNSYRQRITEHQKKLTNYKANPNAYDNKGFLKKAPNEQVRQRIINGRVKHLEGEIKTFQKNIDKVLKAKKR